MNDSAKVIDSAADIANAMLDFVTGIDFKQTMIAVLSSQDLAKNSLQPLIDANLQTINDQYADIPGIDLLLSRKLWADNNRLTLYVAPNPLPNVLQTGVMSGQISWDPNAVTGSCTELNIAASVQTGPPVLLSSDGVTFSPAPVLGVGGFSANPIGPSACSYTLSALATGLPNALIASTSLGAANPHSSSSPYTGRLHSSTTIYPQGWSGDYVVPNAENRNYVVVSGMTAGGPIGKLKKDEVVRIPNPGDERTAAPGAANQNLQSPASKVEINPQPLPPKNLKPRNLGSGQ